MNTPFSAWKEGAAQYIPALLAAALCFYFARKGYTIAWVGVGVLGFYGLFALFFFRDPPRAITATPNEFVSPADGTIVGIEDLVETPHYSGPCRRVSIFLAVWSVHVNRAPFEGTVQAVKYKEGAFVDARKSESSERNESNAVWMQTPHGPVTVRQISGAVARRIVCRTKVGDTLAKGQKFGMIKLGSRTELYLPPGTEVCVKMGDKVYAGKTTLGHF